MIRINFENDFTGRPIKLRLAVSKLITIKKIAGDDRNAFNKLFL